jgi:hypothetical protein
MLRKVLHMAKRRRATLPEVRWGVTNSGRGPYVEIQAGPVWSYRWTGYSYQPIEEYWEDVTQQIWERVNKGRDKVNCLKVYQCARYHICTCSLCGRDFIGHGLCRYCSNTCSENRPRSKRKSNAKPMTLATCVVCKREFERKRVDAKTCSVKCRVAAHRAKPRA